MVPYEFAGAEFGTQLVKCKECQNVDRWAPEALDKGFLCAFCGSKGKGPAETRNSGSVMI
jgi:hypothetical protein